MNSVEKNYVDQFQKAIDSFIPDFTSPEEQLQFYELMKSTGLNMAKAILDTTIPLLDEMKAIVGADGAVYKELSDYLVKQVTDLIFVEINPNTILANASGIDSFQKKKILSQNQFATSLINRIEGHYKGVSQRSENQAVKNKIAIIDKSLNPKSGCYIATIVYGDFTSREVSILREYRDSNLSKHYIGKILIWLYYKSQSILYPIVDNNPKLQKLIKKVLDTIVKEICTK